MNHTYYMNSPEQMLTLLNDLVSIKSITFDEEEKHLPLRVKQHLMNLPYFQEHPTNIENHLTTDNRLFLTALYKHDKAVKTIVLISHFDVVNIEDYGELKHLAFSPMELTKELHHHKEKLSPEARADLESGEWLFGRGTMDMKCGLVQHMSLLEKAAMEQWEINLLLLTVPDEEVNSVGMREAVPKLLELAKQQTLTYTLFLNSEPMFTQSPGDEDYYYYTGSIGKILPSALCFGKETHVGEPFLGINAAWMSAVLSQEIEWNEKLCEFVNGESTPPPTLLLQRDLKKEYSVQIPHRSVSMYNLFIMRRNPADIMTLMKEVTTEATTKMETFIRHKSPSSQAESIRVITYEELRAYACAKSSPEYIASIENAVAKERKGDNRIQSITIVDQIAMSCQELAPMIVLFYAPPYYPAVNTEKNPVIPVLMQSLTTYTKEMFSHKMIPIQYFNGISDLSYCTLQAPLSSMKTYDQNLPGDKELYDIPFDEMAQFKAPVLNIGPVGRDAHQKTERLHIPFAFEQLPKMLEHVIKVHQKQ